MTSKSGSKCLKLKENHEPFLWSINVREDILVLVQLEYRQYKIVVHLLFTIRR